MSVYPLDKKFEAFNCHVINVDGHDFDQLRAALKEARETTGMPTVIVAKTIKGKGFHLWKINKDGMEEHQMKNNTMLQ